MKFHDTEIVYKVQHQVSWRWLHKHLTNWVWSFSTKRFGCAMWRKSSDHRSAPRKKTRLYCCITSFNTCISYFFCCVYCWLVWIRLCLYKHRFANLAMLWQLLTTVSRKVVLTKARYSASRKPYFIAWLGWQFCTASLPVILCVNLSCTIFWLQ